jgi:hypothetical protein
VPSLGGRPPRCAASVATFRRGGRLVQAPVHRVESVSPAGGEHSHGRTSHGLVSSRFDYHQKKGDARTLATTTETAGRAGLGVDRDTTVRRTTETKHATKTTELYVLVAAVIGVLVAASQADNLDARGAWQLITALAIGYMISRGLAKSGSREAYTDRY